jgi:glycosyltransferase-like protein
MIGPSPRLRIAILAHSTNPRGGVVHALELVAALTRLGHVAVVHAPDRTGRGFFRSSIAPTVSVAASATDAGVTSMVETRIADYVRHFENPAHRRFDVFHAQDGISGNALATLKQRGLIRRYARTVHHVDDFNDPRLRQLDQRSIIHADRLFVVSRLWQDRLKADMSCTATLVGNGVDTDRYSPRPAPDDRLLRARLGLRDGPVLLAIGGIEARKNTHAILDAFRQVHAIHRSAQLVIAGGASLLDHDTYRQQFKLRLRTTALPADAVIQAGPIAEADMPSLYRLAAALVFPSLREGFGLVVLEAMASGVPVVVSRIAPFTEYLGDDDVAWCDPHHAGGIANAIVSALAEPLRSRLAANGRMVAQRHDWSRTAAAHLPVYQSISEVHYA